MPRTEGFTRTKSPRLGGDGDNTCFLMYSNPDTIAFNTGATNYCPPNGTMGAFAVAGLEVLMAHVLPRGGTLRNLYVAVGTAPGAGKSWAVTVRVNGVNTALTCTIANLATTANDVANTVAVVAGDRVSVIWVPNGVPANPVNEYHSMELLMT